jgi:hypothetical protein
MINISLNFDFFFCYKLCYIFLYLFFYYYLKFGDTALIYASHYGYFEIVKFLIENNAEVNIQNKVFFYIYI